LLHFIIKPNGQKFWQLSLWTSPKFCRKVRKIFWTQPFCLGQILLHLISFMNKVFCSGWIWQLPTQHYNIQHNSTWLCHLWWVLSLCWPVLTCHTSESLLNQCVKKWKHILPTYGKIWHWLPSRSTNYLQLAVCWMKQNNEK
jgi:hypothetical protein